MDGQGAISTMYVSDSNCFSLKPWFTQFNSMLIICFTLLLDFISGLFWRGWISISSFSWSWMWSVRCRGKSSSETYRHSSLWGPDSPKRHIYIFICESPLSYSPECGQGLLRVVLDILAPWARKLTAKSALTALSCWTKVLPLQRSTTTPLLPPPLEFSCKKNRPCLHCYN